MTVPAQPPVATSAAPAARSTSYPDGVPHAVAGGDRLQLLRRHHIRAARATPDGVRLSRQDHATGHEHTEHYDAVVLATGYRREGHKRLLDPLVPWLGDFAVDRHYRVESTPDFHPAVFLQGACESSHGLSDTLLSVTSVRTGEIGGALMAATTHPPSIPAARAERRTVST